MTVLARRRGTTHGDPIVNTGNRQLRDKFRQLADYYLGNHNLSDLEVVEYTAELFNKIRNNLFHGTKVYDDREDRALLELVNPSYRENQDTLRVATVLLQSTGNFTNHGRTEIVARVLEKLNNSVDVILFPAGFYTTNGNPRELFDYVTSSVEQLLHAKNSEITVCLGIDGREGKDQIAIALGSKGIVAAGRKFHPTASEADSIALAPSYNALEEGYSRFSRSRVGASFSLYAMMDTASDKERYRILV